MIKEKGKKGIYKFIIFIRIFDHGNVPFCIISDKKLRNLFNFRQIVFYALETFLKTLFVILKKTPFFISNEFF